MGTNSMDWKILISLAVICIVCHYGPMPIIYVFVALVCFLFGLLLAVEKSPDFPTLFQKKKYDGSVGIPSVVALMDSTGVPKANVKMSDSPELDAVLNQVISYIIRDYIYTWYSPLTPDTIFPTELHRLLQQLVANTVKRLESVDWIPFLTESLPSELAVHIRLYRTMLERSALYPESELTKLFFDCEAETEKTVCREGICMSREQEREYLRSVSEAFLYMVLPTEEYRVPAIRYMARELLVNAVLVPTIDLIADPDFVNRSVAWFAKDSAFTSDYFIQALRMSDSTDELDVVVTQINTFMDKLRGRDTGGDDDAIIKAQLGSLEYVRKICFTRIRQIKEGVAEKPEHLLAYHLQPGMKLYDMTFKEMMSSSVALVNFLDFLTSVEKDGLLRLYLNCASYRQNSRSAIEDDGSSNAIRPTVSPSAESIDQPPDSDNPEKVAEDSSLAGPCGFDSTDVFSESPDDSHSIPNGSVTDSITSDDVSSLPPELSANELNGLDLVNSEDKFGDLRAFGILLCNNLLKHFPPSAEPMIKRALRLLTVNTGPPDPDAFAEIESKLTELLSDPQCFGAFKRSTQYVQLLAELDLLKDLPEQSPPPVSTSQSLENGTSESQSQQQQQQQEKPSANASITPPTTQTITTVGTMTSTVTTTPSIAVPAPSTTTTTPPSTSLSRSPGSPSFGNSMVGSLFNSLKLGFSSDTEGAANTEPKKRTETTGVSSTVSVGPHAETYTAHIVRTEIMRDSYVVYTIKVTCTSVVTGHTDCWQTLRRFSHFAELHAIINDRCGRIPKLKLPSKRAFSNMSRDFLAKRRRELNEYLAVMCSPEFFANHPAARAIVVEFLQPDSWERGKGQTRGVSAILNPLRTMGNAMKAVPDTLADGFSKMLQVSGGGPSGSQNASHPGWFGNDNSQARSQTSSETGAVSDSGKSGDPMDSPGADDSPIERIFLVVDEMFDLQRRSHLSRESNFVLLRKIFQAFFGPRVNKMIITKAARMTSAEKMVEFVAYLRDSVFPPTDPGQPTTQQNVRAKEVKLRTQVLCRTMLLGSISEELAQFLGNETTRRGVVRFFRLLQDERLNRRFIHFILEAILCQLFRPHQAYWETLFEKNLCPVKSGRPCRVHSKAT
ncbi:unnamed protein product [Calicophoron daubneyi]|uniref:Sorting nexin-13 n=1 Tax=Calicophoron daubneyi TaxID=300641 RepID=A0AAV2TP13_CALDB